MMEDHEFCDDCPGCRPAVLDIRTNKPVPDNAPLMVAVNRVWDEDTTYAQRKAYIEVTLHNSKLPHELKLAKEVATKIATAIKEADDAI